ncbi:MAG: winged helix-turn-helix transcriptional regulator [Acidobacteriota bacterium]
MTLRPGSPARGSTSGRPLMVLLDALGRRWTLRILWELRRGPLHFRALRSACDEASPSVLNDRLRLLRELKLVELTGSGYELTHHGRELGSTLAHLDTWAGAWAETLDEGHGGNT